MNCLECGCQIPAERLEILPNTDTCASCSKTQAYVGFMDWYHKTAPEIVMVNPSNKEDVRRAIRVNCRSR